MTETSLPVRHMLFSWPVDLFTKQGLLSFLHARLSGRARTTIANLNLHALYCLERSEAMASLVQADQTVVHIDGMPIVWLLRLGGVKAKAEKRLTYLDWAVDALALCEQEGWKVAYIGSTPEICTRGVEHFRRLFPRLELQGWDGYFDMNDQSEKSKRVSLIHEVNVYGPDLLIVGMGMPRQEEFLARYSAELSYSVAVCSGAFFEYFTGGQRRPPRIMGRMGLEWLYRLAQDPRRYAHRYLLEPLLLAAVLARAEARKAVSRRRAGE